MCHEHRRCTVFLIFGKFEILYSALSFFPHLYSLREEELHHFRVLVDDGDGEPGAAERVGAVQVEKLGLK